MMVNRENRSCLALKNHQKSIRLIKLFINLSLDLQYFPSNYIKKYINVNKFNL